MCICVCSYVDIGRERDECIMQGVGLHDGEAGKVGRHLCRPGHEGGQLGLQSPGQIPTLEETSVLLLGLSTDWTQLTQII